MPLNMMSCYLKTKQYDECIIEGTEVLAYDSHNVKALDRRGQAYKELSQLGDAVSDLSKAHEVSRDDETIADVLRDAEERLRKEGAGRSSREITEEATVSSFNCENSTSGYSVLRPQEPSESSTSQSADCRVHKSTNADFLKALKDDPVSIRSFQNFISRTEPGTLSAVNGGKVEGISPDMLKTASNSIGKMSPEEFSSMFRLASSVQGENPFSASGSTVNPRPIPSDLSPDMLKTASDMMGKILPEDLQKRYEIASSLEGNEAVTLSSAGFKASSGSVPPTPEMLKMATNMMKKILPEEVKKCLKLLHP